MRLISLAVVCVLGVFLACTGLNRTLAFEPAAERTPQEEAALIEEFKAALGEYSALLQKGKLRESLVALQKGLDLGVTIQPESPFLAQLWRRQGEILMHLEDYAAAKRSFDQALAIEVAAFGAGHHKVGTTRSAIRQAEIMAAMSADDRAEMKRGDKLNSKAYQLYQQGEYEQSAQLLQEHVAILERLLPSPHPDIALTLGSLGTSLVAAGSLMEARVCMDRSLAQFEQIYPASEYPDRHPMLAVALNAQGTAYKSLGDEPGARQAFERSLAILERFYELDPNDGENLGRLSTALQNLAIMLVAIGEYPAAREHVERALEVMKMKNAPAAVAPGGVSFAMANKLLAETLWALGEYALAQVQLEATLSMFEQLFPASQFPQGHHQTADCLGKLGSLLATQEKFDEAIAHWEKSLQIIGAWYPADRYPQGHLDVAASLNNFAVVLDAAGKKDRAAELLMRAATMTDALFPESQYPQGHPELASMLGNAAVQLHKQGKLDEARPLYARSRAMFERLYPPELFPHGHPRLDACLINNAIVQVADGRPHEALGTIAYGERNGRAAMSDVFSNVAERTIRSYYRSDTDWISLLVTLLQSEKDDAAQDMAQAFDLVLLRKSFIFDALLKLRQAERAAAEQEDVGKMIGDLRTLRQELANLALAPGDEGAKSSAEKAKQIGELEVALTRQLTEGATLAAPRAFAPEAIAGVLDSDQALVEIVRYRSYDYARHESLVDCYAAFVMRNRVDSVQLIDLGPRKPIDALVAKLRRSTEGASRELAVADEKSVEEEFRAMSRQLYDLVFAPLRQALGDARHVIIAPDGELNSIPFETLVDAEGCYLIESLATSYVTSGQDLLSPPLPLASSTVVFAACDYNLDGKSAAPSAELLARLRGNDKATLTASLPLDVRGLTWQPLPATLDEAAAIERLLSSNSSYAPVVKVLDGEALEGALKRQKAPRILHLATHGFYLPDEPIKAKGTDEANRGGASAAQRLSSLRIAENPLLRSGVVLAGANRKAEGKSSETEDDGWLTAEEAGLLDLRGTELVVLSACESGLGDVRFGEGVSGLRRAFAYAGARALITSLYQVPDAATQVLMREFYTRLAAGKGKQQSLREAQLALIASRREEVGAAHPFFWGSFILVGDPH